MSDVKSRAEQIALNVLPPLGYELVDVEYKKLFGQQTLIFYIDTDKEGGISLDDCELVSHALDEVLDKEDITDGLAYNLNVSSPGLDRPLKKERDFVKKKGSKIEINFYAPFDGKKKIEGVLSSWTESTVTIEVNGKELSFDRKTISIIKPVIEF